MMRLATWKWKLIVALGSLLLIQGCTTTLPQGVTPPEVTLVSFRLHEVRVLESDAIFVLRIDNDGPAPMSISGGVHKIFIDGMRIGKAQSGQQLRLPPFSSSTQEVLAHVSNLRFLTRFKEFYRSGRSRPPRRRRTAEEPAIASSGVYAYAWRVC